MWSVWSVTYLPGFHPWRGVPGRGFPKGETAAGGRAARPFALEQAGPWGGLGVQRADAQRTGRAVSLELECEHGGDAGAQHVEHLVEESCAQAAGGSGGPCGRRARRGGRGLPRAARAGRFRERFFVTAGEEARRRWERPTRASSHPPTSTAVDEPGPSPSSRLSSRRDRLRWQRDCGSDSRGRRRSTRASCNRDEPRTCRCR